jgi:hypothetical protein
VQGNRKGVSLKRDAELKIQRAVSHIHGYGIFPILIWLPRVPKCGQVISHLPTTRRSGSKESFKKRPKKSRFKKRKFRAFEVNEWFNVLGMPAELL